ncbi:MAG: HDOD domain-containing protein [Lysobacterales bacterium]
MQNAAEQLPQEDTDLEHISAAVAAEISAGDLELPLLPTSAMQVFHLASDADADIAKVAGMIERDQKLATGVLRVANSVAYSPRQEIVTLRQAIMRLGLKSLCEIVLGAAFKATVFSDDRYMEPMQEYWRSGIGTALWAKELARLRRKNVETAYLCGMLHNVGKPMTLKIIAGLDGAPAFDDRLASVVDQFAVEVGAILADLWQLPEVVKTCITHQQDFESAENYRDEACAVQAATHLMSVTSTKASAERADDPADSGQNPDLGTEPPPDLTQTLMALPCFQELNIYPDDLAGLLGQQSRLALALESFS